MPQTISDVGNMRVFTALSVLLLILACVSPVSSEQLTCIACDAGFYLNQTSLRCQACPSHSTTYDGSNATEPTDCICVAGFTNGTEACEPCALATFKPFIGNYSCHLCTEHASTPDVGSVSVDQCGCVEGFTRDLDDPDDPCVPCAPGSYKNFFGDAECLACPADSFCPEQAINPTPCPSRSQSPEGSGSLADCLCDPGTHYDTTQDAFICVACAPGTFNSLPHQSECTLCPEDTYLEGRSAVSLDECLQCPANAHSPAGSNNRTDCLCALGYAGEPGDPCVACSPGYYREDADEYICSACPSGTYNVVAASPSAAACLLCPEGQDSAAGSDELADCVCDPGNFAVRDGLGWLCTPCAPGQYQPLSNASACDACVAGKFSTAVEAVAEDVCTGCADGHFSLGAASTCTACASSEWQDLNDPLRHATYCEPCPANSTHELTASTSIFDCTCAIGLFAQDTALARTCELCPPGHFCPGDNTAQACPDNHWSPGGVFPGPCIQCAEHSVATGPQISSPLYCQCLAGTEGTHDADCSLCLPGKFQPDFLGTTGNLAVPVTCQDCAPNFYSDAAGALECSQCAGNSSSPQGSNHVTDCLCNPGFYGDAGGPCDVCERNHFCTGGSALVSCRPHSVSPPGSDEYNDCKCIPGYYSATAGAVCLRCPPGSYCPGDTAIYQCAENSNSRAGADAIEDCWCLPGMWRGCIDTPAGPLDADGLSCVVPWAQPCVLCDSNTVCANNTLLLCPEFSTAPAGSHSPSACVCDDGYYDSRTLIVSL